MQQLIANLLSLPRRAAALPRNVKLFLFTVLMYGVAVEGISSVLLNLYLLRLGYGTEFIGTLNSAGMLIFAMVSLPLGAVQRFSSRRMMQFGQIMSFTGLLGLPLAYFASADQNQAALLILFRIMAMIGLSAYFVHQLPFAMEITPPAWHDRILAITMATFSLAAFMGSWVGGLLPELIGNQLGLALSDAQPYQLAMLLASGVVLPAMIATLLIVDDVSNEDIANNKVEEKLATSSSTEGTPEQVKITQPSLRPIIGLVITIILIRAMQTSGVGVMQTFSNVYFDDALNLPTSRIGLISGLGRLLGVPLSLTIPWLVRRFGNYRLVIISLGLIIMLMLPIALIPYWPVASIALISINSMGSLRYLSFIAFTMSLVTDKQRSLISGAGEMAIGIGFATSSFIGGFLIAWYGYRELFLFGAGLTTLGTIAFWLTFRNRAATMPLRPSPATD